MVREQLHLSILRGLVSLLKFSFALVSCPPPPLPSPSSSIMVTNLNSDGLKSTYTHGAIPGGGHFELHASLQLKKVAPSPAMSPTPGHGSGGLSGLSVGLRVRAGSHARRGLGERRSVRRGGLPHRRRSPPRALDLHRSPRPGGGGGSARPRRPERHLRHRRGRSQGDGAHRAEGDDHAVTWTLGAGTLKGVGLRSGDQLVVGYASATGDHAIPVDVAYHPTSALTIAGALSSAAAARRAPVYRGESCG
jgi:hypothetical protein